MANLNQHHEAMLRRHRPALIRFAAVSRVAPERLAFVVADARSRMGQVMRQHGVAVTERASVVIPLTVDAVPALLAAAGCDEVQQLVAEHGAVPVIVIDEDDMVCVAWERVLPDAATAEPQNRLIKVDQSQ